METTIKVTRKDRKTIIVNDKGNKWTVDGLDSESAIAALVFFTVKHRFDRLSCFEDNFTIKVTLEQIIENKD